MAGGSLSLGVISGSVSISTAALSEAADSIKEMVANIQESFASLGRIGADVSAASGEATDALSSMGEDARATFAGVGEEASAAFRDLGEQAQSAGAEASGALRDVGESAEESKGALSGLGEGFSGLLGNIKGMVGAMLAFEAVQKGIELATSAFHDMTDAATAMQQNQALTVKTLQSTHDASGQTAQSIDQLADSISGFMPVSQEAVQSGENMLLTFTGIGKKTFPQATQAAVDMATYFNNGLAPSAMQVQQKALQLGMALNDPAKGLTRLTREGVTFSAQQVAQIKAMEKAGNTAGAQAIMLAELHKEFSGAEASGKTFSGMLTIAKNKLIDAGANILNSFVPALQSIATALSPLMTAFESALPGAVKTISGAASQFGKLLSGQVSDAVKGLTTHGSDLAGFLRSLGGYVQSTILPILGALWTIFTKDIVPIIRTAAGVFAHDILPVLTKVGTAVTQKLLPPLMRIIGDVLPVLNPALQLLGWLFGNIIGPAALFLVNIIGGLLTALAGVVDVVKHVVQFLGQFKPVLIAVGILLAALFAPIGLVVAAFILLVTHLSQVGAAFGALFGAIGNFVGNVLGAIGGLIGNVLGFFGNLITSLPAKLLLVELAGLKALAHLAGNFLGAVGNLVGGVLGFIGNLVFGVPRKIGEMELAVLAKLKTLIGNFLGMVGGWKDDALTAVGKLADGILNFFGSLPAKMLTLGVKLIQGLINGITSMAGKVGDAIKNTVKNVPVIGGLASHIPGFATGSENTPAGLATLAENGPELVIGPSLANLAAGSKVIPISQLGSTPSLAANGGSALAGGAGGALGGNTFNTITFTVEVTPEAGDASSPFAAGQAFGQGIGSALQVEMTRQGRH